MKKLKESESVSRSVVSDSFDSMDCSPPGVSVHGIFQERILEWVAIPFSMGEGITDPGIEPGSPALQVDSLPSKSPGKPISYIRSIRKTSLSFRFQVQY